MTRRAPKTRNALDISQASKTLTTAYTGYYTDAVFCQEYDTLRLLCSISGWDGTSLEIMSQIRDDVDGDWHSELKNTSGTISLDSGSVADSVLDAESDTVAIPVDVRGIVQIRFAFKRTGGSAGDLTVLATGG